MAFSSVERDILIRILGEDGFTAVSDSVSKGLSGLDREIISVDESLGLLTGAFDLVSMGFEAVAKTAQTLSIGLGAIGATGVAALTNIVAVGADFEQAMANVTSVTGGGSAAMKELSDAARKMGRDSIFSASQAADGMYYLASAGFDTQQTIAALEGVMSLAGATMTDLSFTSESVVSTLGQFGMEASEASRVSNVFAAAIGKSQLQMRDLADGMKYIGPIARNLNWSLEATSAALGELSNLGYKGEMAGTALRAAMSALLNVTDDAAEALNGMNVSLDMVNPTTRSLADIIDVLRANGLTAADSMKIFGERAGPAMLALVTQGSAGLRDMTAAITGTTAAEDMLRIQTDTVVGQWKLFKSALEEVWLNLYEHIGPALKTVIKYITDQVNSINNWLATSGGVVAWGTVITTALSMVGSLILGLVGFFPLLTAALIAFAPVGLAMAAALGFIYVGFKKLGEYAGIFDSEWSITRANFIQTVTDIWTTVQEKFTEIYAKVSEWWEIHIPLIIEALKQFNADWAHYSNEIKKVFGTAIDGIGDIIEEWLNSDTGSLNALGKALVAFSEGRWADGLALLKDAVSLTFDEISNTIKRWWDELAINISVWFANNKDDLLDTMEKIGFALADAMVEGFTTWYKKKWSEFWDQSFPDDMTWGQWWDNWNADFRDFNNYARGQGYGAGAGYSTDLPGGHDEQHYSGTKSRAGGNNIIINLPPGSSREQAEHMARAANRMMQLGWGY